MLKYGVVQPAMPARTSSAVFLLKNDENLPVCADYREVSAMVLKDAYPSSRMYECIGSLGDAPFSLHWTAPLDTGKSRYSKRPAMKTLFPAITGYTDLFVCRVA